MAWCRQVNIDPDLYRHMTPLGHNKLTGAYMCDQPLISLDKRERNVNKYGTHITHIIQDNNQTPCE